MLFKVIVGVNSVSNSIHTLYDLYKKDSNGYFIYKEQNFSTTIFVNEPPVEYINIPDKEDVIHMCSEKHFNSFRITLKKEIYNQIKSDLSIKNDRYMNDYLEEEGASIFFIIDPRDGSNIEKFENFLGFENKELSAEILKNNVE